MTKRHLCIGIALVLLAAGPAWSQGTRLFGGGDWDFENGFYFETFNQDGRTQFFGIGVNWDTAVILEEFGVPAFNENKNTANLTSGAHSQEISMTFRDGKGWIHRTINVPANHRIRFEADVKAEYGETPPIPSMIIDPTGGTNPQGPNTIRWTHPEVPDDEPGSPLGLFKRIKHAEVIPGGRVTLFIGVERDIAGDGAATFMVDNVEVWDEGPVVTPTPTPAPEPNATWLLY